MLGALVLAPEQAFLVEQLKMPVIASSDWESHPAFDSRSRDLWFVRSDPHFSGWRLMIARCRAEGWSSPEAAPLSGDGVEADPYFTSDGTQLYFISSRATGSTQSAGLDIWIANRDTAGRWFPPQRLPEPVNSAEAEWFPRPGPDGWLYFGSRRPGGFGKDDIWRARRTPHGWYVENAGPAINTADAEYEFEPSADGQWALLAAASGIYRVDNVSGRWGNRVWMGPPVNSNGTEIGPLLAPDGRSFLFSRNAEDGKSGELYIAKLGGDSNWPPCGPAG
jgi:hypothetical protein